MWVKGGNAIWGDATFAPDDEEGGHHTHGQLISFRQTVPMLPNVNDTDTSPFTQGQTQFAKAQSLNNRLTSPASNMTVDEAGAWILGHTPPTFRVTLSPFLHTL